MGDSSTTDLLAAMNVVRSDISSIKSEVTTIKGD